MNNKQLIAISLLFINLNIQSIDTRKTKIIGMIYEKEIIDIQKHASHYGLAAFTVSFKEGDFLYCTKDNFNKKVCTFLPSGMTADEKLFDKISDLYDTKISCFKR